VEKTGFLMRIVFGAEIFLILAHPVFKMRIIQETAFRREKNGDYAACLKYSVRIVVEEILKM
jgi:hypothetical protein